MVRLNSPLQYPPEPLGLPVGVDFGYGGGLVERKRKEEEKAARQETQNLSRPGRWEVRGKRIFVHPDKFEEGLLRRDVVQMLRDFDL